MMNQEYSKNSDGLIPSLIQYDTESVINNNIAQQVVKIKKEVFDATRQIDTYGMFQPEPEQIYNAVWKENYFASIQSLNEERGPKYKCSECSEIFVTKLSLLTHSKAHLKPFCIACLFYFDSQQEMNQHLTNFHAAYVDLTISEISYSNFPTVFKTEPIFDQIEHVDCGDVLMIEEKLKVSSGRKMSIKTRSLSARKKTTYESIESTFENPTKTLTSRFGRCITVKMPNY